MNNSWANKIRLYGNILVPSSLSLAISTTIALISLAVYHWQVFLNHFEVNGTLRSSNFLSGRLNKFLGWVFGTKAINGAILIIFWAAIGLIIYVLGRVLAKDISELSLEVKERNNFLWPRNTRPKILERFFERILFSVAILIVLIIYCSRVLSFFLRGKILALPLFGASLESWLRAHSLINNIVFVLVEIIALQVVVILLRLLFMRSRLFSH